MNHWIIVPVVLPSMMAPFIVLALRRDMLLQRVFSAAATVALLAVSIALTVAAAGGPPELYALGNWPAPFRIVLVLARLAALMVLLTSLLPVAVVISAISSGWDNAGRHFPDMYPFSRPDERGFGKEC